MADTPGISDRCGFRYDLKELKEIYVLGRGTGWLVCSECWEPSHPQLDTRKVKTNDTQSVANSRSDLSELEESRRQYGWNPVGAEATSTAVGHVGRIRVTTT